MIFRLGTPNRKQRRFFKSRRKFIAYGGARGGGKSWAVRQKAVMLALRYPGAKLLILRRSYPELRENIILPMLGEIAELIRGRGAVWRAQDKELVFANGSRIIAGYCATDSDLLQYQGNEYDFIFLEEATQYPQHVFEVLAASLRGANDIPKRMYLTCNPGGVGHAWVKRLFIDRDYQEGENPEDYEFIQALVYDNSILLEKDPGYLDNLKKLSPSLRKAWLEGEWDLFDGQYFSEFRRERHTVEPFAIPDGWTRYVTLDYGMDMLAAYWIAVDPAGRAWVYRELYEGKDNQKGEGGRGHIVSMAARRLLETNGSDRIRSWLAPPDLWNRNRDTGKSTADIFREHGVRLTRTSNQRIAGWRAVREWLAPDEEDRPGLRIFTSCPNLIRTLPALQFDTQRTEDVDNEPHEYTHGPDALRGFCIYRGVRKPEPPEEVRHTILDDFRDGEEGESALGEGDEIVVV